MAHVCIELRPQAEQTALNLQRWEQVLADPKLAKIEGRVETDRHGNLVMSLPPAPRHGRFQLKIGKLLDSLLPDGKALTECPISTADGVKGCDIAWASSECWRALGNRACFIKSPEICVEVLSPSNSEEEIREKMILYFDAGAKEVWVCGNFGKMSFFEPGATSIPSSRICPNFPSEMEF